MNRRRLLQALVAAGVAGLAGCTSPDREASAEQTPMDTPEPTPELTPTPTPELTPTAMPYFFFFKQKTAYEVLRSDWSSDVALPISDPETGKLTDGPDMEYRCYAASAEA